MLITSVSTAQLTESVKFEDHFRWCQLLGTFYQGTSRKYTKNTTEVTRFSLVLFFLGKEGYSPLKNRIYHILSSHPTLSACWGGTSPICHPTGPHQSHKYTKNTTKVTRFSSNLVTYLPEVLASIPPNTSTPLFFKSISAALMALILFSNFSL